MYFGKFLKTFKMF